MYQVPDWLIPSFMAHYKQPNNLNTRDSFKVCPPLQDFLLEELLERDKSIQVREGKLQVLVTAMFNPLLV